MVLVNGAEGIGTGWSTYIPNYNPRDIVANLKRLLAGEGQVIGERPFDCIFVTMYFPGTFFSWFKIVLCLLR